MQAVSHAIAYRPHPSHRYETMSKKSKLVWDLFCLVSGKVDHTAVDVFLDEGCDVEATTIWINSNAYLDGKMLGYLADRLPKLNELILHTGGPFSNELNDADLSAFAQKKRHIQYLTLQGIPNVSGDGFLAMVQTLDSLIEFSTDFPIEDRHAEALLQRHPSLVSLNLKSRKRYLSSGMLTRIKHLLKSRSLLETRYI